MVNKIAVIGSGLMGSGIAYVSAWNGITVAMVDIKQATSGVNQDISLFQALKTRQLQSRSTYSKRKRGPATHCRRKIHKTDSTKATYQYKNR